MSMFKTNKLYFLLDFSGLVMGASLIAEFHFGASKVCTVWPTQLTLDNRHGSFTASNTSRHIPHSRRTLLTSWDFEEKDPFETQIIATN